MVRYAQCCQPVPGDTVVGYVTRGRGVCIHRGDCPNLLMLAHEPERRLEIDWQEQKGERFLVRLASRATTGAGSTPTSRAARYARRAPTSAAGAHDADGARDRRGAGRGREPRAPAEDHEGRPPGERRDAKSRGESGSRRPSQVVPTNAESVDIPR